MECTNTHFENCTKLWLLGKSIGRTLESELPSQNTILRRFLHFHQIENINVSASKVTEEIKKIWAENKIPSIQKQNIINKVKKLHLEWVKLKKNINLTSETENKKRKIFIDKINFLFDVGYADTIERVNDDEALELYLSVKHGMRNNTVNLSDFKSSSEGNSSAHIKIKVNQVMKNSKKIVENERKEEEIDLSDSQSEIDDSSDDLYVPERRKLKLRNSDSNPEVNINSKEICAAFDRAGTSCGSASLIIQSTLHTLGYNVKNIACSKSTIWRCRKQIREKNANEEKESFLFDDCLTIHWDGKLLPDLNSKKKIHRLSVDVTGETTAKCLGVPKITASTGEAQAEAVFQLLNEWKLTEKVISMCTDTTGSNTGKHKGAIMLLQQKLNKFLFYLACRHHMLELLAGAAFNALFESSAGPDIQLFRRFQDSWETIDQGKFESCLKDKKVTVFLTSAIRSNAITFIKDQLKNFHPRDDYKELLELSLLFLGTNLTPNITIKTPGAFHRARWMAKLIYNLKIYLFRKQFKLTESEVSGLQKFNSFVVKTYLQHWFTCRSAISAPLNDLNLLKELDYYKKTIPSIAEPTIKTFSSHLWYLSEHLVGLAFFDPRISSDKKKLMVDALEKKALIFHLLQLMFQQKRFQK